MGAPLSLTLIEKFLTNVNINTNLPDMCYLKILLMCFSFLFVPITFKLYVPSPTRRSVGAPLSLTLIDKPG